MEVIDLAAVPSRRGLLRGVLDRSIDGVIVRGFLSPELVEVAARRLDAVQEGAEPVVPGAAIRMIGRPLQWSDPGSAQYRRADAEVRAACAALFGPALDVVGHAHELLRALGDLPLDIPRTPGGASHCPVTLRLIPPGACVGPHHELAQLAFPSYTHLRAALDPSALFSFYTSIVPAERGGELLVYGLEHGDPGSDALRDGDGQARPLLDRFPPERVDLGSGDLVVFDSGRLAHQVTTVEGARTRCTLGGLLARDRGRGRLLTWS